MAHHLCGTATVCGSVSQDEFQRKCHAEVRDLKTCASSANCTKSAKKSGRVMTKSSFGLYTTGKTYL